MVTIGLMVGAILGIGIWYAVYGKKEAEAKTLIAPAPEGPYPYGAMPYAHQAIVTDDDLREERKERIEKLDERIPEEVKAGWTEEEQAGGVSLGGDTVRISRVVDGVTLTEV